MSIEVIIIGIVLVAFAFISELYFHYGLGFMPKNFSGSKRKTFWKAEKAEVFNSMFLLIGGILLIILGIWVF